MIAVVSREKSDTLSFKRADPICIGRLPEGSFHFDFLDIREAIHLIQATAADDSNPDLTCHARLTPVTRHVLKTDE